MSEGNDKRPTWRRNRAARLLAASRRKPVRPWYADRLAEAERARKSELGPYETRYEVADGYAFDRLEPIP